MRGTGWTLAELDADEHRAAPVDRAAGRSCALVNHLVSAGEKWQRDRDAKCARGFQIDGKSYSGWPLDREISRWPPVQYLADHTSDLTIQVRDLGAVRYQAA